MARDYQTHVLPRAGAPPLEVEAALIAEASSARSSDATRWHELALYELPPRPDQDELLEVGVDDEHATGPEYVVAVGWRSRWQGEDDADDVILAEDGLPLSGALDLADALGRYDPLRWLRGYPPHPQYAAKQERLRADALDRWAVAVGELFRRAGLSVRLERR